MHEKAATYKHESTCIYRAVKGDWGLLLKPQLCVHPNITISLPPPLHYHCSPHPNYCFVKFPFLYPLSPVSAPSPSPRPFPSPLPFSQSPPLLPVSAPSPSPAFPQSPPLLPVPSPSPSPLPFSQSPPLPPVFCSSPVSAPSPSLCACLSCLISHTSQHLPSSVSQSRDTYPFNETCAPRCRPGSLKRMSYFSALPRGFIVYLLPRILSQVFSGSRRCELGRCCVLVVSGSWAGRALSSQLCLDLTGSAGGPLHLWLVVMSLSPVCHWRQVMLPL